MTIPRSPRTLRVAHTAIRERRVWLRSLRLENFRSYASLDIELEEGLNFFHGPNGAGKTSVLEAVSYLAVARSLRGSSDNEVARWGESGFGVAGECRTGSASRTLVLRYSKGGGKEVTLDGEQLARLSDLVGTLRVAWFCPEDTWITKEGPAARRRLLDMTLCQTDRSYLSALTGYRRALRQRNEALLSWTPDDESERVLEVWTERVVEQGGEIMASRRGFVPRYDEAVREFHSRIAVGDDVSVEYASSIDLGEAGAPIDRAEAADRFRAALGRTKEDERRRGFTLVGPHRDDLLVKLNGRALRSFGSQGQHRTAAIAMKLGEAALLDADGAGVVVLLDDILSELDSERAAALIDLVVEHGQALMTSTMPPPESATSGRRCAGFLVAPGTVARQ